MDPKDTKGLVFILLITGLLIVTPYFFRMWQDNQNSINSETYNILRLYNDIDAKFYDRVQQRHIMFNVLYFIPLKGDYGFLMTKIIVFVIALASIMISYIIMKKHNMPERMIIATLLMFIASPIFISTYMDFTFYAIIIFLALLSIYLFLLGKKLASSVVTCIIPFIDVYSAIIIYAFQYMYILSRNGTVQEYKRVITINLAALFCGIIINYYLGFDIFANLAIVKSNIIADIGANAGFSFSSIILAVIGLVLLWERNWKNIIIYTAIVLLMAAAVYIEILRVYLNMIIVLYAGFAFIYLTKRKWSIAIIKRITILLIVCSIIFTTLVFMTKTVKSEPDLLHIEAFKFLSENVDSNQTILSSATNGYMLEYYTNRRCFIDQKSLIFDKDAVRLLENISSSRNLDRTESWLKADSIKYILIDKEFKKYLEDKEGLLFLMQTSGKFKNIYKKQDIEIWTYSS